MDIIKLNRSCYVNGDEHLIGMRVKFHHYRKEQIGTIQRGNGAVHDEWGNRGVIDKLLVRFDDRQDDCNDEPFEVWIPIQDVEPIDQE